MARQKKWGELSKAARDRAARAGARYGLNRNAVRQRYNRGTYNPLSRDPLKNKPREVRKYVTETGAVDWHEAALQNMRLTFGDYYKYPAANDDAIVGRIYSLSDAMAEYVATASEDELLRLASFQPDADGNPPPIEDWHLPPGMTLDDVSVYVNGEWTNPFWYH